MKKWKSRIRTLQIMLVMGIVICLGGWWAGHISWKENLWPRQDHSEIYSFSDADDGGKSVIHWLRTEDDVLEFSYQIQKGFPWPYAGFNMNLTSYSETGEKVCQNLSESDTLVLDFRTTASIAMYVELNTFDPRSSRMDDQESLRLVRYKLQPTRELREHRIALSEFRIPDWWRVQKRIPDSDNQAFFESTCGLSLVWMKYGGTANNLASEEPSFNLLSLDTALTGIDSVTVRNIQVSGVNNRVGTVFLVLLGIWLVAGSVLIKREKVKGLARKNLSQSREMAQKSGTQAPELEWLVLRDDIVG